MEPLTGEALEARIKELEEERDRLLAETPFVRYAPCKTSHGKIRLAFNKRIGCLRKHGVENPLQIDTVKVQMIDTRKARYGSGHGNVQKMLFVDTSNIYQLIVQICQKILNLQKTM